MQQSADDNLTWLALFIDKRRVTPQQVQRWVWRRLEANQALPVEVEALAYEPLVLMQDVVDALPCALDMPSMFRVCEVANLWHEQQWSLNDVTYELFCIAREEECDWSAQQKQSALEWMLDDTNAHRVEVTSFLAPYLQKWASKLALFVDDDARP